MQESDNDAHPEISKPLADLATDTRRLFLQAFITWLIRWMIGFGLIAVVTYFYSNLAWLWPTGALVALISLIWTLGWRMLLSRRLAHTQRKLEELHELEQELGQNED